jgi:hypothetical protein
MNGNENEADVSVEDNETLVQLVLQATDYDNLRPYLEQPVVLKGTLFGAITGFHHTQVLMQQVQLVSGMAPAPVDCELWNQKVGMHEETYKACTSGQDRRYQSLDLPRAQPDLHRQTRIPHPRHRRYR